MGSGKWTCCCNTLSGATVVTVAMTTTASMPTTFYVICTGQMVLRKGKCIGWWTGGIDKESWKYIRNDIGSRYYAITIIVMI